MTMRRRVSWAWVAAVNLVVGSEVASAQAPAAPSTSAPRAGSVSALGGYANPIPPGGSAYTSPYANPYTSPVFNPYLNPYMDPAAIPAEAAALSILRARNANGAIGSGRISGVRAAEAGYGFGPEYGRPSSAQSRAASRMPRTVALPGTGAERYFQRSPARGGSASNYFGRGLRRTSR
jgi:hypothetical protein